MYQYSPMGNGAIIATPLFGLPSHLRTLRVYTQIVCMSIGVVYKMYTYFEFIVHKTYNGDYMIKYRQNVMELLKNSGYSTYYIRKNKIFGERELQKLRTGEMLSWQTFNIVCELLQCQPGDILEWVPDSAPSDTNTP